MGSEPFENSEQLTGDNPDDQIDETSHCTTECYAVEARMMCPENPIIDIGGQQFDGRWRRVRISHETTGVPVGLPYSPEARYRRFLSYAAAMSIGYWLLAAAEMKGIEFRLVKYEVQTDVKVTRKVSLPGIKQNYGLPEPKP